LTRSKPDRAAQPVSTDPVNAATPRKTEGHKLVFPQPRSFIIKLLFSTVTEDQLPILKNALEWKAHVFINDDPSWRNKGPISRFERAIGVVRLIQIDVSGATSEARRDGSWERSDMTATPRARRRGNA
jgi:hypothetical protein